MKMKEKTSRLVSRFLLLPLGLFCIYLGAAHGATYEVLSGGPLWNKYNADTKKSGNLTSGKQVTAPEKRSARHNNESQSGKEPIWTEVRVAQIVNATPEEVAGLYFNYSEYPNIFQGVSMFQFNEVRTVDTNSPKVTGKYTITIGIPQFSISNVKVSYNMENTWAKGTMSRKLTNSDAQPSPGSYIGKWVYLANTSELPEAGMIDRAANSDEALKEPINHVEGYIYVEPLKVKGTNGEEKTVTLMEYYQYINAAIYRSLLNSAKSNSLFIQNQQETTAAARTVIEKKSQKIADQAKNFCGFIGCP